ncbi:hypothetical protein GCM10022252_23790 [Streptosporangium oxazolinicum]|uniref:Uncharacterized protein n=1 Tax=Streptosporangium oxazolinicum TaxID=909287 RepID=A0ABP8AR18_9ACTN
MRRPTTVLVGFPAGTVALSPPATRSLPRFADPRGHLYATMTEETR